MAGPAMMRHSSRTRIPARTCGFDPGVGGLVEAGNGAGGEESSILVTSHGGIESTFLPCASD